MTEGTDNRDGLLESLGDFRDLKQQWTQLPRQPVVKHASKVARYRVAGFDVAILLTGEESAGAMGVYEMSGKPGARVPPHHQTDEEEYFFIIEGDWEFQIGDEIRQVGPATLLVAPRKVTHAFAVTSEFGRLVSWNSPAGHERFFQEMVPLLEAGRMDEVAVKAPIYETVFDRPE